MIETSEGEKDPLMHVAPRANDCPTGAPIDTAQISVCNRCGHRVWCSPASLAHTADIAAKEGIQRIIVCLPCADLMIKNSGQPPVFVNPSRAMMAEMLEKKKQEKTHET